MSESFHPHHSREEKVHEKELLSLEMRISKFLRVGVLVAGGVMLIGWFGSLAQTHTDWTFNRFAAFETYRAMPLTQEISEAVQTHQWSKLVSYAGLVLLISLPITRVLLTTILFFKQKEKIMGSIALFVLLALAVSMLLGFEL